MTRLRAITNRQGDTLAINESSIYGIDIEWVNTAPYTNEFLGMLFHEQEFSANDIYSILVRTYNNTI